MKFFKLIVIPPLLCLLNLFICKGSTGLYCYFGNNSAFDKQAASKHRILVINTKKSLGGAEIYALNLYKTLLKKGIFATFLTSHDAKLKTLLLAEKLPFYSCQPQNIQKAIFAICKKHHLSIIHCNRLIETLAARNIARKFPVKIFYTHHVNNRISPDISPFIDGVIGVNSSIHKRCTQSQDTDHFLRQKITCIPPFCNEEKFLTFTPVLSRKDFFQEMFTIKILEDIPIICLIGHLYTTGNKNHMLLLKAAHKLMYERQKPIQLIFAGNGEPWYYQKLAQKYNINDNTHFLGATEKIPELLFYSDINILPSKKEAFGIVVLEGAFMKKPTIVSSVIGSAETLIIDEKTGLVFENNNIESLVEKIERLLDHPDLARQLGENAYHHALKYYSNEVKLEKLLAFYDEVTQPQSGI